jgi:acetate kinase
VKPSIDRDLHVLALNSGSSSLKFGLYRARKAAIECLLSGEAERIGGADSAFHAEDAAHRNLLNETAPIADQQVAVMRIANLLVERGTPPPQAIGHRIVHGGPHLREHCLIDAEVMRQLSAAGAFAPLHTPAALAVIGFASKHFPGLPQVACIDTCFHATMPPVASTLALPAELRRAGIQRYGFHGLSCESIVRQLTGTLPARLIIAHLGNGASVTAVRDGKSIDTSMGLTPTGGVIMGTRSGDLDPGVLVYLMREMKFDAAAIEALVDHRSGLLGLSGISSDMRALHSAAAANDDARLAIEMFCYAVTKEIGAMTSALQGVDLLVLTGGIGEHDAEVRARICAGFPCFGHTLDEARNRQGTGQVSRDGALSQVQVLPSQEDEQIAYHTWALS